MNWIEYGINYKSTSNQQNDMFAVGAVLGIIYRFIPVLLRLNIDMLLTYLLWAIGIVYISRK